MKQLVHIIICILLSLPKLLFGQVYAPPAYPVGLKTNFIRAWTPGMASSDISIVTSPFRTTREVDATTQYIDGLGRVIQTVTKKITPGGKDMVSPVIYDDQGRERYKFLPYPSQSVDGSFNTNPFFDQATYMINAYAGEQYTYTKMDFEESPLNRVVKTLSPGNSWAGSGRGVSREYLVNTTADTVRLWTISTSPGAYPVSDSYYPTGELYVNISIDEANHKIVEYKDKEGRLILKKVQIATSPGGAYTGWLSTYYVYDDLGNLRYVLPPKAVEHLVSNGWNLADSTFRRELCFRNEYDGRKRVIVKQAPGTQPVEMVYDVRDRLVFMQDGNMRPASGLPGKWLTTLYDELNRPIMKAFYTTSQNRSQLESELATATATETIVTTIPTTTNLIVASHDGRLIYKARKSIEFIDGFDSNTSEFETILDSTDIQTTETIYANNPLPSLDENDLEVLIYTYYDNYDYPGKKDPYTADYTKPQEGNNPYKEAVAVNQMPVGQLTGSKVRILGMDEWLTTTSYYDKKGRVQQILSDNAAGGIDIITNLYDFSGRLLSNYHRHRSPRSSQTLETTLLTMNSYDDGGRIDKITKRLNDDDTNLQRDIVTIEYDEAGQLKEKTFKMPNGDPLENLVYDYNIRGWVAAINREYVSGSVAHYFGQELGYDAGFTNQEFTGNIAGIKWKGFNDPVARRYDFKYDAANRLLKADFTQQAGSNWDQSAGVNFDVKMGNGATGAYDANGNIMRMQQWGLKAGGSSQIDDLFYTLQKTGNVYTNKLYKVNDAYNDPSSALGDFKDQHPDYTEDYDYDLNGNLIIDHNKNISSIYYNHLNLPERVDITGKGKIEYIYDAMGVKQRKIVTDQTVSPEKVTTTDYIGDYVYENNELQYVRHEEGRIRAKITVGQPVSFVYDYFLKDHLGNVRTVLTEETSQHLYKATMEPAQGAVENALFSNIDNTRTAKPSGYSDGTTSPNDYVARLNGDAGSQKTGPSLVLRVMAGDKVQIGAKAFYKSTGTHTAATPVSSILSALVGAFAGNDLPGGKGTSVDAASPLSNNFSPADYQRLREQDPSQNQTNKPRAYLNFVLFDDQFKLVDGNSGARQVQGVPDELQTLATSQMTMQKSGYLYVYTNNESLENVYFDNVVVLHEPGPLLEETHYYPFGLTMSGISSKAVGKLQNKRGFNGNELQSGEFADGSGLELYDFNVRSYDPQLGRFLNSDPATELAYDWTGYRFGFNNPVLLNDPTGLWEGKYDRGDAGFDQIISSLQSGTFNINGGEDEKKKQTKKGNAYAAPAVVFSELVTAYTATRGAEQTGLLAPGGLSNFLYRDYWNGAWADFNSKFELNPEVGATGLAVPMVSAVATVLHYFGKPKGGEGSTTTTLHTNDYVLLYRGVHFGHPDYANALLGRATPRGGPRGGKGHTDPAAHNYYNNRSVFTSWTLFPTIANNFATNGGQSNGGIILIKLFKYSEITISPDRFGEGEMLIRGTVTGALPVPAVRSLGRSTFGD
ncbi:DUF6443 domain-containing protein [Chitinophaga niabensis]|uniref:RHS repeat-associated core domain-containing protein n=1 Tax=Chitinophaga niabensis TaxID=536979 RepID=A0A1N6EKQ0_9BACT|nr:DUF6443 domain-containing protein [Chitinophaga niabensis]SIN83603.1 RHS repeat-associated core domain-containing protein [Chitinophaga niabensis]